MRFYTINGEKYPSVTTILNVAIAKPQLVQWVANCCTNHLREELFGFRRADSYSPGEVEKIFKRSATAHKDVLRAAGNRGTEAHKKIEDYAKEVLKDRSANRDIAVTAKDPLVAAFQSWETSRRFCVTASESVVYSLEHKYAGTADLVGFIKSQQQQEFAVLDIKTSKHSYPEHKLQLAAYAIAIGEMTGRLPHYCAVLHIPDVDSETPTITEVNSFTSAELFPLFQTFLAAKRLFEWLLSVQEKVQPAQQSYSKQDIEIPI